MKEKKIIEIGKNFRDFIFGIVLGVIVGIVFLFVFLPIINYYFPCPPRDFMTLETAKNHACSMLVSVGCEYNINSIHVNDFDANKNGISNEKEDSLLALCQYYYGCEDENCCKINVCGCSE